MKITWVDREREPQSPPNPDYPDGINIDVSHGASSICVANLPYPAKRCGLYLVKCEVCGTTALVTTAGRLDDPRSVTMACQREGRHDPTKKGGGRNRPPVDQ